MHLTPRAAAPSVSTVEVRTHKRIEYIDILKFFGILFIYAGHYTTSAGLLYPFVFAFHVPLFFFISGCTETFNRETHIGKNIWKKVTGILLPFYLFAFAAIVVKALVSGGTPGTVRDYLILIAKGCIRNTYFASSLWFLSCLFIVSVLFELMKLLKSRWVMLLCSLALFASSVSGFVHFPSVYNIHFAVHYQLYYVIGYLIFNTTHKCLTSDHRFCRAIILVTGIVSLVYTGLLFFQYNLFSPLSTLPVLSEFVPVFTALTAIWFFLLLSYLLRRVKLFADLGQSTLYFCGSEFLVKSTVNRFLSLFFTINMNSGLSALVCSFLLLLGEQKYLVPIESKLFNSLKAKCNTFFK